MAGGGANAGRCSVDARGRPLLLLLAARARARRRSQRGRLAAEQAERARRAAEQRDRAARAEATLRLLGALMPMATGGMYQVTLLDFFMPGIWTNTFTITPAWGPVESAVFTFCIDG